VLHSSNVFNDVAAQDLEISGTKSLEQPPCSPDLAPGEFYHNYSIMNMKQEHDFFY
jgi:hypothetical protein